MRTQLISAAVALGLSAVIPTAAKADRPREDRHEIRSEERHEVIRDREIRHDRVEHFERDHDRVYFAPVVVADPDFCVPVSPAALPSCIVDTAVRTTGGCVIQSADYVRQAGALFYDVRVGRPYAPAEILRIRVDGCLLPG